MTRNRWLLVSVVFMGLTLATLGFAFHGSAHGPSREALARSTAREFFQAINARRFEKTCELMSAGFYRENHVPNKARCILALRAGFTWAPSFRFRITSVRVDGDRATVRALANGAPGAIQLVEDAGRFKVLSVGSS